MSKKTLMTELTPDVLEKLQETHIEILSEIVRICKKHNLCYFLIYGTLIGAIRHEGFIPWDDDLDIGMPRSDYDKFMKIAKTELGEKYYLQNSDSESEYWLTFSKVRKNNTLFEEPTLAKVEEHVHKGIFVDIFPFDYVRKKQGNLVHVQFILSKALSETMYYKAGVFIDVKSLNYKRLDMVLKCFPMGILTKWQSKIASLQKAETAKYIADFNSSRKYLDAIFPVEWFMPVQESEFAGKMFHVPNGYHEYLTRIYGDYMKLPKEEERENHRTLRIVFDIEKEL